MENKLELIKLLQNTDDAVRRTVFFGIGFTIAAMETIIDEHDTTIRKIKISRLVNEINELAIISQTELLTIVESVVKHRLMITKPNYIESCVLNTIEDMFCMSDYFGVVDLENIIKNAGVFKSALFRSKTFLVHNKYDK